MFGSIIREDIATILGADLPWGAFSGKRVLITGASGMLASYLVETLLHLDAAAVQQPPKVIGLVRNLPRARARFAHHLHRAELHLVQGDVSLPIHLDERMDFIVHAASQASPKYYTIDPVGTLTANVVGTQQLLEHARHHASEGFLFVSSGEVYGQGGTIPSKEGDYGYLDPASVRSCYAESKRMAETMCVCWHHQHRVPTYIVRPFHTYGPGLALDDGRVFADFVANIIAGRDLVLKSNGSAQRAFCYVTDAIVGIFTVLLKGNAATPYNVGNDEAELSIAQLAHTLVGAFPERRLQVIIDPQQAASTYAKSPIIRNCPDTSRLRGLGWKPKVGVAEGFRRTVAAFEEQQAAGSRNETST